MLEPLRNISVPNFGGVIFRRTSPMIRAEGGLWDASKGLYSLIDAAYPRESRLEWVFPNAVKLKFSHLEYEKNIYDWQGSEIPFIGFDELTHFTSSMFFYLVSRNRSTCGVKPYIRATCNPDPDSWVAELIAWWIGEDGFPIRDREGVVRWFMRDNDNYIWGDTAEECIEKGAHIIDKMVKESGIDPINFVKSITFISGSIYDNKALLTTNPQYLGNLNAQSEEEKLRLLAGNWKAKASKTDIYDYFAFQDMFTNNHVSPGERCITTDIALKGSDKFVIFVWSGRILIDFMVMDKSNGREVVDNIRAMAKKHRVPYRNIIFDNDGLGGFVDGFIPGALEFNNGARAMLDQNYRNLKTQCYYISGDNVAKSMYYIPQEVANKKYNDKRTLKDQLNHERKAVKRDKVDMDGKLTIIGKSEMKAYIGNKSPDLMDAFMMREFLDLTPRRIVSVNYS